jgi:hypothetical protein
MGHRPAGSLVSRLASIEHYLQWERSKEMRQQHKAAQNSYEKAVSPEGGLSRRDLDRSPKAALLIVESGRSRSSSFVRLLFVGRMGPFDLLDC